MHVVLDMDLGGLQRVVNILVHSMDRSRYEFHLCVLDREGVFYADAASVCATTRVLGRRPGKFDGSMFCRLVAAIRETGVHVVHSHNGCSLNAALAARIAGAKTAIHTDHGRLVPDRPGAILEDRLASWSLDWYVGVSCELTEYLHRHVRVPRRKLTTIVNGVDTCMYRLRLPADRETMRHRLGLDPNERIVGTVCRLDPIKNLDLMISAMAGIVRGVPGSRLLIAGDGPIRSRLEQVAVISGVADRVTFLGYVGDTSTLMPVFDVYACTSLSEGTSMTILEAMSCGVPVVASAVGGNRTLVNETCGYLFPSGDSRAFEDSVVRLLQNADERARMGGEARRRVERQFSVQAMNEGYARLYASATR